MLSRNQRLLIAFFALGVFLLAFWARVRSLPVSMMLDDAVGPWLLAWGDPLSGDAHRAFYGWGMLVPYRLALRFSASLWEAVAVLQVFHALIAPLVLVVILTWRSSAWIAGCVASVVLALDPGLLDTAVSGAEGYLAPLWIGCMVLAYHARERFWAPFVMWLSFAMAVMNHPFSLCAAPFLWGAVGRTQSQGWAFVLGTVLLGPHLWSIWPVGTGNTGGLSLSVPEAFDAWLTQGGPSAWILFFAPWVALARKSTRGMALLTLASLFLLLGAGFWQGYLRDHHLRLLAVPMAACLAVVDGPWIVLVLALIRPDFVQLPPPGAPPRPGTLGMETGLASEISRLPLQNGLQIDGAWLSGALVAEPSALMLDLHLRGRELSDFRTGEDLLILVSVERDKEKLFWNSPAVVARGDHHVLLLNPGDETREFCSLGGRLGGAWNFFAVAHPSLELEALTQWYPDCSTLKPASARENR